MKKRLIRPWSADEDAMLERVYPTGGVAAVKALTGRSKGSIIKHAGCLGVSCKREVLLAEPIAPLQHMDLLESLACVQLRKWRGPVSHGPLRWRLAA